MKTKSNCLRKVANTNTNTNAKLILPNTHFSADFPPLCQGDRLGVVKIEFTGQSVIFGGKC